MKLFDYETSFFTRNNFLILHVNFRKMNTKLTKPQQKYYRKCKKDYAAKNHKK